MHPLVDVAVRGGLLDPARTAVGRLQHLGAVAGCVAGDGIGGEEHPLHPLGGGRRLRDPAGAAWAYREPYFLSMFDEAELEQWQRAKAEALAGGTFVFASGLHCAVGTKPES